MLFSKELPKYGIGFHYRNVGTCASKETSRESALELVSHAYETSLAYTHGKGWTI
jgi:hypothetical protein